MAEKFIGFVQESSGEITKKICAAIQEVLDKPAPTEDKVYEAVRQMGCRITSLNFSPRTGTEGEIRGGKMAEFRFTVIFGDREIKGGTWIL